MSDHHENDLQVKTSMGGNVVHPSRCKQRYQAAAVPPKSVRSKNLIETQSVTTKRNIHLSCPPFNQDSTSSDVSARESSKGVNND